MESAQLQLVLNVIAITGVSSLASFSYLRRRDRKLAVERRAAGPAAAMERSTPNPAPQDTAPVTSTTAPIELDIRDFVANRRTKWVSGVAAAGRLSWPGNV
jgi:hypothetical protein